MKNFFIKKVITFLLGLSMAISMFGCVPNNTPIDSDGPKPGENTPPSTTTDNKTLTIMAARSPGVIDFDTNAYIIWLEEQTGVDVTWLQVPGESLIDKLPVVMMSNDLPDAFLGCALNATQQVQYGQLEKIILPLNDLIDQYGTETKRMFSEQKGTEDIITISDGNIYSLPSYSDIIHVNYAQKLQINTTFLESLDMEMPTNTEEFYNYLKAVKENDPNGNGIADEIPLIGNIQGWHHDLFPWLTEPFIFDDGMYGKKVDVDENGKIFSILDKDGYHDALRYIRKLYAEGLLYEPSLNMKADQYKPIGENPDNMILGAAFAPGNGSFTEVGGERYQHYRALPPIKGPTGLQQTPWFRYANVRPGAYSITKSCDDLETAFKFGDFMLSYEASMRSRMGEKDIDWRDAKPDELTINNTPAEWFRIIPYTGEAQNKHLDNDGMFYETRGMFLDDSAVAPNTDIMSGIASQFLLAQETTEKYVDYAKEVFPPVSIPAEFLEEFVSLETELKTYYQQARAAFVSGSTDIEKDWDKYVKGLETIGLDRYVEILQIAYDQAAVKIGS